MDLLDTIKIILLIRDQHLKKAKDEGLEADGEFGLDEICTILTLNGITLQLQFVRYIIAKLPPRPTDEDPMRRIERLMWGFLIVVTHTKNGRTTEEIIQQIRHFGFYWEYEFVCEIMNAQTWWAEYSGNGNSW